MHVHLPKPLHSWREFLGEVGIIVVGVLIALSAEQLVETWHRHQEISETRQALDAELGYDLAAFRYRMKLQPCADRRLAELSSVVEKERHGHFVKLKHEVTAPIGFNLHFGIWDSATGETRSQIPLQIKLQYASLYERLRAFQEFRDSERIAWNQLLDVDFEDRLSDQELREARAAINRMRRSDELLPGYVSLLQNAANPLHIGPAADVAASVRGISRKNTAALCSPLI